jgi:hypothetical protein
MKAGGLHRLAVALGRQTPCPPAKAPAAVGGCVAFIPPQNALRRVRPPCNKKRDA